MLQTLDCSYTEVVDLGPLSAFTMLQTLNCSDCEQVTDLGPLSACKRLLNLDCSYCQVAVLSPLAACTALVDLKCDFDRVLEAEIQHLQAACGSPVVTQDPDMRQCEYGEIVHPALHPRLPPAT